MLSLAEEDVAMVDGSGEGHDVHHAEPAFATPAIGHHTHARRFQRSEHGLAGLHLHAHAQARRVDCETLGGEASAGAEGLVDEALGLAVAGLPEAARPFQQGEGTQT